MGIKIDIDGANISGNSTVLNGVKISGNSSVDIEVENSEIKENSRVLNGLDVENAQVEVKLKDLSLGKDAEFMNDRKFTGSASHKHEQDHTEETTKTTVKKDGF